MKNAANKRERNLIFNAENAEGLSVMDVLVVPFPGSVRFAEIKLQKRIRLISI